MPQLPRRDVPTVTAAGMPMPQASPPSAAAFGAGLGEAIVDVGEVIGRIALEEKRKAQSLTLQSFDRELGDWELRNVHDPERGALSRRGRDAFSLSDPEEGVLPTFDRWAQERIGAIADEDVRERAEVLYDNRRRVMGVTVLRHEANERERFDAEETAAAVDNARQLGAVHYRDPQRRGLELDRMSRLVIQRGARAGWPEEKVGEELRRAWTAFHGGVLERFLDAENPDPTAARAYYDEVKDEIDAGMRERIEKRLGQESTRVRALLEADRLWSKHAGDPRAAFEAARAIANPDLRDAVEQRLDARRAREASLVRAERERAFQGALAQLDAGRDLADMDLSELDTPQRNALRAEWQFRRYGDKQGMGEQDLTAWYSYKQLPPAEKIHVDLWSALRPHVPRTEFMRLVEEQEALRDRAMARQARPEQTRVLSLSTRLERSAKEAGIIPWTKRASPDQQQRYWALQQHVDDGVRELENGLGRKATTEEIQGVIDRALIEGRTPGAGWFGRGETRYFFENGPGWTPAAEEIPPADRQAIEQALREAGQDVTEEAVGAVWAEWLGKTR